MTELTQNISPEIVKAELTLSLSKEGLAYQAILQECEDVVFTNDNLNEKRDCLVNLRKVKSKLAAIENPFTERWKNWNTSKKSLADPVDELLGRKESEFKKKAAENAAAEKKIEDEKIRVKSIKDSIDNFFIAQSQAIAGAINPEELVRIEKLIGSHKANSSRYAEFLPIMAEKAANLTDLIKAQKIALKELEGLKQAEIAAEANGDDQEVLDNRDAQEAILQKIHENKEIVQSKAIHMATEADVIEVDVIAPVAPKARRTSIKWEIVDEKVATKCGYTKVVPNEERIEAYVKSVNKVDIGPDGLVLFGIKVYLEKTY